MAGRGQHFIPNHLLKGFADSKTDQLWMYRAGNAKPFRSARDNAAKQRDFYSSPSSGGEQTLDDKITSHENKVFDREIISLRKLQPGDKVDAQLAASAVAHLVFRTAHVRHSFTDAFSSLVDYFADESKDPSELASMFGFDRFTPTPPVDRMLSEQLEQLPLQALGLPISAIKRIGYLKMREQFGSIHKELSEDLRRQFDPRCAVPKTIREAHGKALIQGVVPKKPRETLAEMRWTIDFTDHPVILPDCVALAIEESGRWYSPMYGLKDAEHIILPLASHRLLIGTRGEQRPDLEAFNRQAARVSYQFFLSERSDSGLADLHLLIGEAHRQHITELVEQAYQSVQEDFGTTTLEALAADYEEPDSEETRSPQSNTIQYSVSFRDCADNKTAEKVANELKALTAIVHQNWPLDNLEGITFANDYNAAIVELDRGFEPSRQPNLTDNELGQGVAIPLGVQREDGFKTHIIARAWLAHALIADEDRAKREAISVLIGFLVSTGLTKQIATAFPGTYGKPINDPLEAAFFPYTDGLYLRYASDLVAARFMPERLAGFQKVVVQALSNLQQDIPAARWAYSNDGDLDGFVKTTLETLEWFMSRCADLTGMADALEQPLLSEDAWAVFEEAQLADWLRLFQSDLRTLHEKWPDWDGFEELFVFNRHLESLLVGFGVLVEELPDGSIYVHVP